jgi:hypothetical protein
VNLWRDTISGVANVLLPLNEAGLRAEWVPFVGFEGTW